MNQKYRFFPNASTGCLSDEDTKKYFSRVGFAVFAFILAGGLAATAIATVYASIAMKFFPWLLTVPEYLLIATEIIDLLVTCCVALPIFLVLLKPLPKVTPFKSKMSVGGFLGGFCIALLFLYIGNTVSSTLLSSIESITQSATTNPVSNMISESSIWITILFSVILTPIIEEILFRKILCDRLLPLGEGYAILISSAIFSLIHGNFYQFAYSFLLGLLFSFIYVKTGKLIYSIIYHMIVNFVGTVVIVWISKLLDWNAIQKLSETEITDPYATLTQLIQLAWPLLIYSTALMIIYIIGLVLIFKANKKKLVKLDTGILPPPKQHRVSNVLLTSGAAAAIAISVFRFVLSLLP